jgi:hypothetical protein
MRKALVLPAVAALLLAAAVPALALTQRFSVPVDGILVPDVCGQDVVVLSGSLDVTTDVDVLQGSNAVTLRVQYNAGGIKGTGVSSGDKFVGNGAGNLKARVDGPFPARFGLPFHFFLLRQGSDRDLKVSGLLHGTVNGSGEVSNRAVEVRKAECGSFC